MLNRWILASVPVILLVGAFFSLTPNWSAIASEDRFDSPRPMLDTSFTVIDGPCGDVNGDTTSNILDIVAILRLATDPAQLEIIQAVLGDLSQDGAINVPDAMFGLMLIVGLPIQDECGPLPATLFSPEDMANTLDTTPLLTWENVNFPFLLQYRLQVSSAEGFESPEIDVVIGSTSFLIPDEQALVPDTYFWRVQALADDIVVTDWSEPFALNIPRLIPLAITSPPNLSATNQTSLTVSGTVEEGASVVVNGVDAIVDGDMFTADDVPVVEGKNIITATASNNAGEGATSSITVTRDTTPPVIVIESPRSGLTTQQRDVPLVGAINDAVVGIVNGEDVTISCNGLSAEVRNRSFAVHSFPLRVGSNAIECQATDRAGNAAMNLPVEVTRLSMAGQRIELVSGQNQRGMVGEPLPELLSVKLVSADGSPVADRAVTFDVTRGNGMLSSADAEDRTISVNTDEDGIASAEFILGTRAGHGTQRVTATAVGFIGEVEFIATSDAAIPDRIIASSGESQVGVVGENLPLPLVALVSDANSNALADVPVTFTVTEGDGSIEGETEVTKLADDNGYAEVVFTLGSSENINGNAVEASFEGLTGLPAVFVSTGLVPGPVADTTVSGIVLDNADQPIPGATASIKGTALEAISSEDGLFTITDVPVGTLHLVVDGSTSTRDDAVFPTLEYKLVTVAGRDNTVGRPILMPAIDMDGAQMCGGDEECVVQLANVAGAEVRIAPHSITVNGEPWVGEVSFTQVHADNVPMMPPNGGIPAPATTIQPGASKGGAFTLHFDPPAEVTFPNTTGLPPGSQGEIYSFDHDLEEFISVGYATVSDDGSEVVSDPGYGITKSGWVCWDCLIPPPTCSMSVGVRIVAPNPNFIPVEGQVTGRAIGSAQVSGTRCPDAFGTHSFSWSFEPSSDTPSANVLISGETPDGRVTLTGVHFGHGKLKVKYTFTLPGVGSESADDELFVVVD